MEGESKVVVKEFIRKSFNNGVVMQAFRGIENRILYGILTRSKGDNEATKRYRQIVEEKHDVKVMPIDLEEFVKMSDADEFDECRKLMTRTIVMFGFMRETMQCEGRSAWPMFTEVSRDFRDLKVYGITPPPGERKTIFVVQDVFESPPNPKV